MIKPGDILDSKYEIIRSIGRGGMSKVWLARDTNRKLNRLWAVKEISKTTEVYKKTVDEKKALHEIEIMKDLDHPALPRIVDVIDNPSAICVVMDYIQGTTLQNILEEYGTQNEKAVVSWMLEVCDILTYLHSKNPPIIYRDIKPSNLMLNNDGHIKIIDFGIARENKGDDTMPLGSEGYASPEHFTGNTDERSDVYTVGSTAYAMLTGKNQTVAPYYIEPIRKIDPSLSQGLEKVILKATKKDPKDRYQTAAELANALESYEKLDDEYIDSLKRRIGAFKRRFIIAASAVVLGIALLISGIIIDQSNYNNLVTSPGGKQATKITNLEKAIDLKPGREDAYLALIEVYAEDGDFTEEESERFFKKYNENKNSIPPNTSYKIGESYLRYYTGTTDSSARAKLLTAEPFFKASKDDDDVGPLAEGYVFLAEYYKTFVMSDDSLLTGAGTEKDYEEMLSVCEKTINSAPNEKMKEITAEATLSLIQSQLTELKETSVSESDVSSLVELAGSSGGEAEKDLSEDLKKEIKRTYHPKKEG